MAENLNQSSATTPRRRFWLIAFPFATIGAAGVIISLCALLLPIVEYDIAAKPMTDLGAYVIQTSEMSPLGGPSGIGGVSFQDDRSNLSDEELKQLVPHLQTLPNLEELSFLAQPISDNGLKELATLHQLERIDLIGTRCTLKGINELRRSLPNCKINSNIEKPDLMW